MTWDVLTNAEMISSVYGVALVGNDEELEGRDHLGGEVAGAVKDMVMVLLVGDSKTDAITTIIAKTSWEPKLFG